MLYKSHRLVQTRQPLTPGLQVTPNSFLCGLGLSYYLMCFAIRSTDDPQFEWFKKNDEIHEALGNQQLMVLMLTYCIQNHKGIASCL